MLNEETDIVIYHFEWAVWQYLPKIQMYILVAKYYLKKFILQISHTSVWRCYLKDDNCSIDCKSKHCPLILELLNYDIHSEEYCTIILMR